MKICIVGAGAIGGTLAARLEQAGEEVSVIARGPHLAAIHESGLLYRTPETAFTTHPAASDNPDDFGPQDFVILTVKAPSLPGIAPALAPLIGPETSVVAAMNGIPWWFCDALPEPLKGRSLETVDPGGVQWDKIGPERIIGCVVYPAAEVIEPGVIKHIEGNRFSLGEPSGEKTDRVQALAGELQKGGLRVPIRPRIRDEMWVKLWGNLSFNPISALTGATLEQMCTEPDTRALIKAMMLEAQEVGEKIGVKFPVDVEKRIEGGKAVGAHKTSMLQDLERGRPMEIDALVAAVSEMGRMTDTPTPNLDGVLALVKMRARLAGCYDG